MIEMQKLFFSPNISQIFPQPILGSKLHITIQKESGILEDHL